MNKQIALEISLLLWKDIHEKALRLKRLSKYFYLVEHFICNCSLCELHKSTDFLGVDCTSCCLNKQELCHKENSVFQKWKYSLNGEESKPFSFILWKALEQEYQKEFGAIDYEELSYNYQNGQICQQ